jgi:hypothetical protein
MADAKITALTAHPNPALADLIAVVGDPGGTPETKKSTVAQVLALAGNLVSTRQTTDFSQAGAQASFTQLGTIEPSITLLGTTMLVILSGRFSTSTGEELSEVRLSIDSGASTVQLGRFRGDDLGMNPATIEYVTGLTAGAHTVKVEYKKPGAGTLLLRASTQPQIERFSITLFEIL